MRRGEGLLAAALLAGLVAALVVLLPASPAAACSCAEVGPVDEALLADYDAAFTGEVTRNEAVDDRMLRRELEVAVDEVFTGTAEEQQLVVTHAQTSACGIDPAVGTEVLFLTTEGPSFEPGLAEAGELVVGSCGGHRAASEASALGPGRPPEQAAAAEGDEDPIPEDDLGSPAWLPVAGLALAAAIVLTIIGASVALTARALRRAGGGGPA